MYVINFQCFSHSICKKKQKKMFYMILLSLANNYEYLELKNTIHINSVILVSVSGKLVSTSRGRAWNHNFAWNENSQKNRRGIPHSSMEDILQSTIRKSMARLV